MIGNSELVPWETPVLGHKEIFVKDKGTTRCLQ